MADPREDRPLVEESDNQSSDLPDHRAAEASVSTRRDLSSLVVPGLLAASQRDLSTLVVPGLLAASQRDLSTLVVPGLLAASQRDLSTLVVPGLLAASQRDLSSLVPGLLNQSNLSLAGTFAPNLSFLGGGIKNAAPYPSIEAAKLVSMTLNGLPTETNRLGTALASIQEVLGSFQTLDRDLETALKSFGPKGAFGRNYGPVQSSMRQVEAAVEGDDELSEALSDPVRDLLEVEEVDDERLVSFADILGWASQAGRSISQIRAWQLLFGLTAGMTRFAMHAADGVPLPGQLFDACATGATVTTFLFAARSPREGQD